MSRKSRYDDWRRKKACAPHQIYNKECNDDSDCEMECNEGSGNNDDIDYNEQLYDTQQERVYGYGRSGKRRRYNNRSNDMGSCGNENTREDHYNVQQERRPETRKKCWPIDGYKLSLYGEPYTPVNVAQDNIDDLCISLVISVEIPVGFVVPCGIDYTKSLNVDDHLLTVNIMTQYYADQRMTSECNNIDGARKMQVAVLNGELNYNLSIGNITPEKPVQDDNLQVYTHFTSSNSIFIDKVLGYAPFGYQPPTYYSIDFIEGDESVTLLDGQCVFRRNNPQEFMTILRNPDVTKVLNCAYKGIIQNNMVPNTRNQGY